MTSLFERSLLLSATMQGQILNCSRRHTYTPHFHVLQRQQPRLIFSTSASPAFANRWRARRIRASAEDAGETTITAAGSKPEKTGVANNFVPVMRPEDLPKGVRKEVRVLGSSVLLFWYRNQIMAIESRSPAEGAYSEGFLNAKLTQDYCIECPTTKSLFSLQTGEIVAWYPTNPVLRALTPLDTCRNLEIYPVKLTQDAILVDVADSVAGDSVGPSTRGGSDSSIDRNNVYSLEPNVYVDSGDALKQEAGPGAGPMTRSKQSNLDPYVLAITIFAVAAVAVAGTALCIYFESFIGLGVFWLALFSIVAATAAQYIKEE